MLKLYSFCIKKSLLTLSLILFGALLYQAFTAQTKMAQAVPTILDIRVNAGSDDAEEGPTYRDLTSSDLEMVFDGASQQTIGMRFNGVTVPAESTITNAYIQFKARSTAGTSALLIQGQAADNAATFTTASGNIASRPRTTAAINWAPPPWSAPGAIGPDQRTPNLASVIQEIVNRPGWTSGNSMAIIITGTSGTRNAWSWNGDAAGAALLHVEYSNIPDTTPPTVFITAPAEGATVSATTTVSANASDNIGVAGVQFLLDGANLGAEDTIAPYSISWETVLGTNGPHELKARARDSAGNIATSTAVNVTVNNALDETPPVITNIATSSVTGSTARIRWTTDELATSKIQYGPDTNYGSFLENTSLKTSHDLTLTALAANATYHFRVISSDARGNTATSTDQILTTLAQNLTPSLTITSPVQSASLPLGKVVVEFATANFTIGGPGARHLHFYVDSDPVAYKFFTGASCDGEGSCVSYQGGHTHLVHWRSATSFEMNGLSAGNHTVRLVLTDSDEYELPSPEAMRILNFSLQAPPAGEFALEQVVTNLDYPVSMVFVPDGRLFVTEQDSGKIRIIDTLGPTWQLRAAPFATLNVGTGGERGLLGITLDPDFATNGYVYVFHTNSSPSVNRVVRFKDVNSVGTEATVLVDGLPSGHGHNSGNLYFGPDGKLYVSLGDVGGWDIAQDPYDPRGKILRYNKDGTIPADNPYPGSPTYALGFRNNFDFTFHPHTGDMWGADNGSTYNDEVNRIVRAGNYGYPVVSGTGSDPAYINPVVVIAISEGVSGIGVIGENSIYPASYHNNLLFEDVDFGQIWRMVLTGPGLSLLGSLSVAYGGGQGILTDVTQGLDGYMYVTALGGSIFRVVLTTPDTTPPSVNITSPSDGVTVTGTIAVSASASDDRNVAGVQFKVDGVNLLAEDTSAPYSINWDTGAFTNGPHTLLAVARDGSGNVATSTPVTVSVNNVPDTTAPVISDVAAGSITSNSASITWATDEPADSQVEYGTTPAYGSSTVLDNSLVTAHSQGIFGLMPSTFYHYRVKSKDAAGNSTTSTNFTFTTLATAATNEVIGLVRESCAGFTNCYTSLQAWEAAFGGVSFGGCLAGDLVCAGKTAVAQIDGSWTGVDAKAVAIDGWTTGPNNFIKIFTTSAARHDGKWNTTRHRLAAGSSVLYVQENYVWVEGLQINSTAAGHAVRIGSNVTSGDLHISHSIIRGTRTAASGNGIHIATAATADTVLKAWNNIIYDFPEYGIRDTTYKSGGVAGHLYEYNNTVHNSGTGLGNRGVAGGGRAATAKNNLAYGNTFDYGSGFVATANNVSKDATSPNVAFRNRIVAFVNEANDDFHLAPADTGAMGQAADLSGDLNLPFSDDIDGQIRTAPWDAGADGF